MRTLVLGGIRSGKSRWAEALFSQNAPVRYLATALPAGDDAAWSQRVARHRDRRPAGWSTIETSDVAGQLRADSALPTIVDDLGGWLTAMLDRRGWVDGQIDTEVDDLVAAVASATDLVLVSPEVGLTVVPPTASGRRFADQLGTLNQRLAECCHRVVLLVAGQPLQIKPT